MRNIFIKALSITLSAICMILLLASCDIMEAGEIFAGGEMEGMTVEEAQNHAKSNLYTISFVLEDGTTYDQAIAQMDDSEKQKWTVHAVKRIDENTGNNNFSLIIKSHTDEEIKISNTSKSFSGKNYLDVAAILQDMGFNNIYLLGLRDYTGFLDFGIKEGIVTAVSIDGLEDYKSYYYYDKSVKIIIKFHTSQYDFDNTLSLPYDHLLDYRHDAGESILVDEDTRTVLIMSHQGGWKTFREEIYDNIVKAKYEGSLDDKISFYFPNEEGKQIGGIISYQSAHDTYTYSFIRTDGTQSEKGYTSLGTPQEILWQAWSQEIAVPYPSIK